jgi:hypothetical protein
VVFVPGQNSIADEAPEEIRPHLLQPPMQDFVPIAEEPLIFDPMWQYPTDPPLGYTGPSSVLPSEGQQTSHFVPMEDRWRSGFPEWDRYDKGHPRIDDYPYVEGNLLNPYNQNVLKGDYPIAGQHSFLNFTAASDMVLETRQVPTPTTPFESQPTPGGKDFFGDPRQFFYTHYFKLSADLNHGDAAFKPTDWRIKLTPIFNLNYLDVNATAPRASAMTFRWTNGSTKPSWPTWDLITISSHSAAARSPSPATFVASSLAT